MNLIHRQAQSFIDDNYLEHGNYKSFLNNLQLELYNYKKHNYKIEFIERCKLILKSGYDDHLNECKSNCLIKKNYENTLFFLQEELDELNSAIDTTIFNTNEKEFQKQNLNSIISDLNTLKLGQEATYDDIIEEIKDLKTLLYLDKKTWNQVFLGKITEMIGAGVVSETISKDLVNLISRHYNDILK